MTSDTQLICVKTTACILVHMANVVVLRNGINSTVTGLIILMVYSTLMYSNSAIEKTKKSSDENKQVVSRTTVSPRTTYPERGRPLFYMISVIFDFFSSY